MDVNFARDQMVDQQVRAWEVLDERVLETLRLVPREHFVPEAYRELAFADAQIPIGHGEVMLTPMQEGRMLQALDIKPTDKAMEIGTGSGFFTACLAHLAARVRSVDIHEDFIETASAKLEQLEIRNVALEAQDGASLTEQNSYDVIAVTGSIPVHEPSYEKALKTGGRLFVVVGSAPVMEACLVTRVSSDEWVRLALFETQAPPLANTPRPSRFKF
jgi:protein-L-isoaspartate(D-aspartate) O-methyltransferase